jgi:lysophospholipase L1-like esterase
VTTTRLVCIGDSFTEGMCDVRRPDGQYLGWADRVAHALASRRDGGSVEYANLAVRGKLLDQVIQEQVPVGSAMAPTLLTFHAGPNDVLRRGTDFSALSRRYATAVAAVAASADRVVLFTAVGRAGGTGRLATLLAERFAQFNSSVREVAAQHGALVVDLEPVTALTDRRLWNEDRLHLTDEGHRRVAAAVLQVLGITDAALLGGEPDWWRIPLPEVPEPSRTESLLADARWIRRHLLPWVGRRLRGVSSGDGRQAKDPTPRVISADGSGRADGGHASAG